MTPRVRHQHSNRYTKAKLRTLGSRHFQHHFHGSSYSYVVLLDIHFFIKHAIFTLDETVNRLVGEVPFS